MKHIKLFKLFESALPSEEELGDCLYDLIDVGIEVDIQLNKNSYFVKFETKDINLLETISKIEGMLDMRVFKVMDGLICIPVNRFNEIKYKNKAFLDLIFNRLKQEGQFFKIDEVNYFYIDLIYLHSGYGFWTTLYDSGLDYSEVQAIIIDIMFERFGLVDLTPNTYGDHRK